MPTRITTVAEAGQGLQAHFPDVVHLSDAKDGRLLAAFRESAGHVRADGRILVVESGDGGETWDEPRVAVDGPWDDRDPKLARLADGTLLLSYFVIDWGTKPRHTVHGTFVRRSTDGGRTWSEAAPVGTASTGDGGACSHGAAAELPGGDLLMPIYGKLPGRTLARATVVRSTDGGRTWPAASEVLLGEDETIHFQEPTLTVLDGQLVTLIRTTADRAYLARSTDGGHTWSEAQPTGMPASSHHALLLSTGEVLLTYGDLSHRFAEHRDTVGRLITRPLETWDGYPDVQIYDSGHPDQANPSSVELAPGRFLTLGFDIPKRTVVGIFTETDHYRG
ncbi:exo-alpha-sialidase [Actinoplanes sp. TBRC 11911]|uniref:sialidase family protein n=1 Tax=Actinoplanes sp. TBRC 11911 TaxID=2729386 RepID=UPI00145C931D|nr:sialidase family protein [Actinoplanes sp. TBRC 11911]NMO56901.1 exo-alpha-sialidase [Actinoplanes sp. TBRC 11911]